MSPTQSSWFGAPGNGNSKTLCNDGERVFYRLFRRRADGKLTSALAVRPAIELPTPASLARLSHEYGLRNELDSAWAARPLELVREDGRTFLMLEDPGGEPLSALIGAPMDVEPFLGIAIGIATALSKAHERGLVHKDLKPSNILVNCSDGRTRLTGFGIASRVPRERQAPELPETIAGTLAYMAPEQTGRMNRSIDARSDLYAFGITLYQLLTGALPFAATDPMEWVHCHLARKPVPPNERFAHVPAPVSAIIMKLLAKTAEERYQTAVGVEHDLRRCLTEWRAGGRIEDFPLGQQDIPDRLLIPEKLYGRAREVEALLAAFDRVAENGLPQLVLVSGYAGIGKSSVVNELHKALVPSRGLFAAGKFDQYKRDIPYSTLAQAFQSLVRPLLGMSEAELGGWRNAIVEALGPNGRLMVDIVPELKLIIGEQPPVSELPSQDAQRRFRLVFRRFIGVFSRPEHPLALFLDDLQWLDAATLDLLEALLTQSALQHLMLVGAYRDNEVTAGHPLMRRLEAIESAGGRVMKITVAPLGEAHLGQLVADSLRCEAERAAPLARLIHAKTGGNPFFAIQFILSLADEGMLAFAHDPPRWAWDVARIDAKGYTDNVVDLMVAKLGRLPPETQRALQQLACLGNIAETATLSMVLGTTHTEVHAALWPAVHQELVERLANDYRFVHDRVQEAAYSLIPEAIRSELHLRIGRALAELTPPEKQEEAIFEIVSQLNRAVSLISSREERERLAEFNLIAGRRAKASTAYVSALKHFVVGSSLLSDDCWQCQRNLIFTLELERAECEFLTGELAAADERLTALSHRTTNALERASVACLRMDVYTTLDRSDQAIAVALDYLRQVGIDWSPHPTWEEAKREYEQVWVQLGTRTIESLTESPLMRDPESLATVGVLNNLGPPAIFTDSNLVLLTVCKAVNLSLERGNCDASCVAYVMLGKIAGPHFGNYEAGFRFGELGYALVERQGLTRFEASTCLCFASFVMRWTRHVRFTGDLLRRAFEAANKIGDVQHAAYACNVLNTDLLFAGKPLVEVQREAEHGLAFAEAAQYGLVIDIIKTQLALIRTLRGLTPKFGSFDDGQFEERRFEQHLSGNPALAIAECWYWIRKQQAYYLAGQYAAAIEAASRSERLLWSTETFIEEAEYHFYAALARAACCGDATVGERQQHFAALAAHHEKLVVWAQNCPENFENRMALVRAEMARLEGRELDAERSYEEAIRSARANDFPHNEALASELAAQFHAARGFEIMAHAYLRNARYGYLRWGAEGKVRQLEEAYPQLGKEESLADTTSTIGTPVERLDLGTVIKVSQAVASEIVLDKLLNTFMRTSIEQAGAERGLLVLSKGVEPRIKARATTDSEAVVVECCDEPVTAQAMPQTLLHQVLRTGESVVIGNAAADPAFSAEPYISARRARSILCVPLITQGRLVGALYLENNLAPGVFAPARIAILKLLASQAAVTLENAHLYRELAQREAKIRRLVDANIVGVFIWDLQGQILEANDAFLRIIGYDRDDLISGRLRWTELTPPNWLDADRQRWIPALEATGAVQPFEKEYLRKDGSRVPVLIGVATFEESRHEGVAFVLDLTERKQAEAEVRDSERRYREVEIALAHANRITTMGELTASITHELKQPIGAAATNAAAGLRWLSAQPPNLEEARQAFANIVNDGARAGEVMNRIRGLVKNAPPCRETLQVNDAIREVVALIRGEADKNNVCIETRLAEDLPFIEGDRVQLQQVMMNLIINGIQAMSAVDEGSRELLISTSQHEQAGVVVTVRDSGPGVASENVEHLFEPFFTTKASGMGMGLSICRSIVQAHGGTLSLSASMPRGAVFQFNLPLQIHGVAASSREQPAR